MKHKTITIVDWKCETPRCRGTVGRRPDYGKDFDANCPFCEKPFTVVKKFTIEYNPVDFNPPPPCKST